MLFNTLQDFALEPKPVKAKRQLAFFSLNLANNKTQLTTGINDKDETNQVTSKQRVTDHGEVFTSQREVNAMLVLYSGILPN